MSYLIEEQRTSGISFGIKYEYVGSFYKKAYECTKMLSNYLWSNLNLIFLSLLEKKMSAVAGSLVINN